MTRPQQESLAGYDAVLARFDRAFEDCTDLERECSDAGLALLTLISQINLLLMAVDYLRRSGEQIVGSHV